MRRNIKTLLEQACHLKSFQEVTDLLLGEFKNQRLLLEKTGFQFYDIEHILSDEIIGGQKIILNIELVEDYNDLLIVKNTLNNRLISNTDNQNRSIEIQNEVLRIKSSFQKS